MKVKDLIIKLSKLDPDLDIYCYEDGPVPIKGERPGPFDLVDVSPASVVISRDSKTDEVNFMFEEEAKSARLVAIIGITPEF